LVVTGLGTLSYAHPRFAIKVLILITLVLISAQTSLSGYRSVLDDNQIKTERNVASSFVPCDSLLKIDADKNVKIKVRRYIVFVQKYRAVKGAVNQALLDSSERVKQINKNCDYFFFIAYAAIIILGIFSFQFLKYKANRKPVDE
jgi:hypothetical protein